MEQVSDQATRQLVRLDTVQAWGLRCAARCGRVVDWHELQIHEEPPRSQGGDPCDVLDCLPLCRWCHQQRTGDVNIGQPLIIRVLGALKCRGVIGFHLKTTGETWFTMPSSQDRFYTLQAAVTALLEISR